MSEATATRPARSGRRKKRHILRRIILWLIVLILLGSIGFYAWARLRAQYRVTYDGYTAQIGTITNALSFSGTLQLIDSETLNAPSDAKVRAVYVAVGDMVSKGDKLVRLSSGETLTASFDGRVNSISVAAGDEVKGGDQLMQVADFEHLKVNIRIDEYDISSVHVGDPCTVTATATEKRFPSTISAISYISSGNNVAYYAGTVYVDVPDGEGVYPGMQVTVSVTQEQAENVVILKMDALSFTPENAAFVYVQNEEDGTMSEKPVTVGVSNGNYVEIREGVSDGDTVYSVSKQSTDDVRAVFSAMFGTQQVNRPQGGYGGYGSGTRNWNNDGTRPGGANGTGGGNR